MLLYVLLFQAKIPYRATEKQFNIKTRTDQCLSLTLQLLWTLFTANQKFIYYDGKI